LRSKKQTHRKIDPYKIWIFEGTIYIIGFCHLRDEVRTFVVDRIKLLRLLDEKFELSSDFDINKPCYCKSSECRKSKASKGDAVVIYRKPLATKELRYYGLSPRVKNMPCETFFYGIQAGFILKASL
jgi:predicted DNA-binding transcriptional regulator YafY